MYGDHEGAVEDLGGPVRFERWLLVATLLAALAPIAVAIVTMAGSDYLPVQDFAVFHLRLRDMLGADTPLVGVYSTFGWNHPGPVGYWMVVPFVWLAGGDGWGMLVGAAVAQGAAIVATAVVTRRAHSDRAALFWVAVAALSYGATGPWVVLEAWNPHMALPFYVLFLATAWCASSQPERRLASVFITGSIVVQLHIGYAPLVLPVAAWIVWHAVKPAGLRGIPRGTRRRLLWSAVVLWSLPLLNDVLHPPGNAARVLNYFLLNGGDDPAAGPVVAARQLADAVRLPPPWLLGSHNVEPLTGTAEGSAVPWVLVAVAAVVAGWFARSRVSATKRNLLDLSWISLIAGLVAIAGVRGQVRLYQFYWIDVVAVVLLSATAVAVWSAIARSRKGWMQVGTAVGLLILAVSSVAVSSARSAELLEPRDSVHRFEAVTRELLNSSTADVPVGPIIVRWVGSPLGGVQAGVVNGLDQRGIDVRVDDGGGFQWGYGREAAIDDASEVWLVSESGYATSYLLSLPGARLVAESSPLTAGQEEEITALQQSLAEILNEAGRQDLLPALDNPLVSFMLEDVPSIDPTDRDRLGELNQLAQDLGPCRCAIVAFPAELAPSLSDNAVLGTAIPAG
jgi:hypothetical protein